LIFVSDAPDFRVQRAGIAAQTEAAELHAPFAML
jgi:hypothetical protein